MNCRCLEFDYGPLFTSRDRRHFSKHNKSRASGPFIREKAMATLRVFGMTVAAGLTAGIASSARHECDLRRQLIEVAPSSARNAAARYFDPWDLRRRPNMSVDREPRTIIEGASHQ